MKLTVVGTQASYALPERANASYLISEKDTKLLFDLGNGSLSHLFEVCEPADLDAVAISHLHMDHFGDIYPLRLYLYFEKKRRLKLYLPTGGKETMECLLSGTGRTVFEEIFDFIPIEEKRYEEGGLTIQFKEVCHLKPTYGVVVSDGKKKIAYTSDTKYCPEVIELATGVDILLSEATLPSEQQVEHLTGADAGRLANEAGCKKLILTHIWPSLDEQNVKKQAEEHFNGPIDIAKEGDVYEV